MDSSIGLIPLLPFLGAAANGLFGRYLPKKLTGVIACATVALSFVISLYWFMINQQMEERVWPVLSNIPWISVGAFQVDIGFYIDPLALIMALVVTGVGFLIHVYSMGYMEHDPGYPRYFAYLNLFVGFMLTLVLANNFLLMFVGWEGVGLCSYLLIGFWFEKHSAARAGNKAFIVNRIGDFCFLLGIMTIFAVFGSLEYQKVFGTVKLLAEGNPSGATLSGLPYAGMVVGLIPLLLFLGATGKSAQIPLYVWLPDAMEGPTPVSALIHAATMVTAGVYMIARCHVLYEAAPDILALVAVVGALTAIFAATIAMVQNDIKRVLAYSTISQLGYMFLACGVGAFGAAVFHLMTHAFFKALLFLGSGSVIHAIGGEQDMRKMGGLKDHLKTTKTVFWIGTLAISGIPPLSGFFSKDEILSSAFIKGEYLLWGIAIITALMTAFYMGRLMYKTFYREFRGDEEAQHHLHESPEMMLVPLRLLAVLSVIGGLVGIPAAFGVPNLLANYIHPSAAPTLTELSEHHPSVALEGGLMIFSALVGAAGLWLARHWFALRPDIPQRMKERFSGAYRGALDKWYVDEACDALVVRPGYRLSLWLWQFMDVRIVDGLVNGTAGMMRLISQGLKTVQTGYVRNYALSMLAGAIILIGYFVFLR
ncbi:MAG: NADH-quinone oxidoreductase subunit L [Armatimonadetes bacterium]|nr:NADH-quinone oxidoreductase subunit L [Armatimonadota bacterium]